MVRASVVMSTYNRARLVGEAIESVLAQTFTDFELIIVDDGSTDETRDVVMSFSDPRVRYIYQENAGLAAGRNTGIESGQAEYVGFLDDDDRYLPAKLAEQVAFMEQNPDIGWTSSGYETIDSDGAVLEEQRPWVAHPRLELIDWLLSCPTCPTAVMMSRSWLRQVGGFCNGGLLEDWDLWIRLSHAGCPMAWVKSILCSYRVHSANMVRDSAKMCRNAIAVLDRFFAGPRVPQECRDLRSEAYARRYLEGGCLAYASGQTREASNCLEQAIRLNPRLLDDRGRPITDTLVACAWHPLTVEPFNYVKEALEHLPPAAAGLHKRRRAIVAQVAAAKLFRAHAEGDGPVARRMFRIAVLNDPSWLKNLGFVSIGMESLLGRAIMRRGRVVRRQLMRGSRA